MRNAVYLEEHLAPLLPPHSSHSFAVIQSKICVLFLRGCGYCGDRPEWTATRDKNRREELDLHQQEKCQTGLMDGEENR